MAKSICCGEECAGTLARGRLQFGFEIREVCYSRNIDRHAGIRTPFKFA
jgi:hypothetical protein